MPKPAPRIADSKAAIDSAATAYGVDSNVLHAIARRESSYDPDAVNGSHVGLYQYSRPTWVERMRQLGTPDQKRVANSFAGLPQAEGVPGSLLDPRLSRLVTQYPPGAGRPRADYPHDPSALQPRRGPGTFLPPFQLSLAPRDPARAWAPKKGFRFGPSKP